MHGDISLSAGGNPTAWATCPPTQAGLGLLTSLSKAKVACPGTAWAPPSHSGEPRLSRPRLEAETAWWASTAGRRGKERGHITSQVSRRRLTAALSSPMTTA